MLQVIALYRGAFNVFHVFSLIFVHKSIIALERNEVYFLVDFFIYISVVCRRTSSGGGARGVAGLIEDI